ncbi:hypothetical protein KI387_039077, partial [Taxus chinensis]
MDGRITSVDGSEGWEADDDMTLVESVGSSMRERGDEGDSSVGGGVEEVCSSVGGGARAKISSIDEV